MVSAWIIVLVVFAILYLYWVVLRWTFDLIEDAHRRLRESEPRTAGAQLAEERDGSA